MAMQLMLTKSIKTKQLIKELKIVQTSHSNHLNHSEQKAPLVYYRGQYRHLAQDYQRPSLAASYVEDVK